jgi:hypothetical protein
VSLNKLWINEIFYFRIAYMGDHPSEMWRISLSDVYFMGGKGKNKVELPLRLNK